MCVPVATLVAAAGFTRREDSGSQAVVDDRGQIADAETGRALVLRGLAAGLARLRPRCNDRTVWPWDSATSA